MIIEHEAIQKVHVSVHWRQNVTQGMSHVLLTLLHVHVLTSFIKLIKLLQNLMKL